MPVFQKEKLRSIVEKRLELRTYPHAPHPHTELWCPVASLLERLNNIVEFTKEKIGRWSILLVSLTVDKPFGNSIVLVGCIVVVFWTRMTNDSTGGNQTINHGPIFAVRILKSGWEIFLIELIGWKNAQSPMIVFNLLFVDDIFVLGWSIYVSV